MNFFNPEQDYINLDNVRKITYCVNPRELNSVVDTYTIYIYYLGTDVTDEYVIDEGEIQDLRSKMSLPKI